MARVHKSVIQEFLAGKSQLMNPLWLEFLYSERERKKTKHRQHDF